MTKKTERKPVLSSDDILKGKAGILASGEEIVYSESDDYVLIDGKKHNKFIECPVCVAHNKTAKKRDRLDPKLRIISENHLWTHHQMTLAEFNDSYDLESRNSEFTDYLHARSIHKKDIEDIDIDIDFYEKALSYYGEQCQWCGSTDKDKLGVYHHDTNRQTINNVFTNNRIDNTVVLCSSCSSKRHYVGSPDKVRGKNKLEKGFTYMLDGLKDVYGLDLADVNFKDTPSRVARAFMEMLQGVDNSQVNKILSQNFPDRYTGMVVVENIECFSMCPHHFLPVRYRVNFGYMPDKNVLGISKIPRFIKLMAQAPVLQELFTQNAVDIFDKHVKPKGSIVFVEGYHMCMGARGIEMPDAATCTSAVTGIFDKNPSVKSEFFRILEQRRGS